jgi:hypothetical protein
VGEIRVRIGDAIERVTAAADAAAAAEAAAQAAA